MSLEMLPLIMQTGRIPAGALRHRTVWQRTIATTQDAHGGDVATPTIMGARRAFAEPLAGQELFTARQIHAKINYRLVLRHADIQPQDIFTVYGIAGESDLTLHAQSVQHMALHSGRATVVLCSTEPVL